MTTWDSALSGLAEKAPESKAPRTTTAPDWDSALSSAEKPYTTLRPLRRATDPKPPGDPSRYDPSVPVGSYLLNEAIKVPGGMLGLVPDAVEWAGKKLTGQPTDFGNVTRSMQEASGANTKMRPPGPGSEKLGMIVQNVVGSLPFAAAAIPARGALGVATELASGLGAGVGQIAGHESGNPWVELAANVLGSAAGYRVGNMVEKTAPIIKMGYEAMASKEARAGAALKARGLVEGSPEYQSALNAQMAAAKGEILGDLSKAYAQEDIAAVSKALDQYDLIKNKIPGFKASVGEITGNEPALAMQAKLESRNIPALEERGARIRANEKAIADARGALVPAVPGAARAALRGAGGTLDDELRALGERQASLGADLSAASGKMGEAATPAAAAGSDLKAASQEGYLASRGTANAKYTAFREAVGPDAPANVDNVTAKLRELQEKFVFDKQPEVLGLIPGVSKTPGREAILRGPDGWATEGKATGMTVAQLDDLSSVANRDIQRELSKANPNRKAIAQLQAIKEEARTAIESALTERGNTDALGKYREATRYFRDEHAPKYLEGVNLKIRQKDAVNEQRIKPESVVDAYFKPNGTTEARRFNTQFADNGPAKETLARGVFDLYKRKVIDVAGGEINPVAHDMFMRKYAATLAEYPWIAKRLEKNAVAGEVSKRMAEVRAQRAEIAASDVAKAVGERDPEAFIAKAVADKRFMFDSLAKMSPKDRENMAIAVLNKAWDQSAEGSAAVNKFMQNEDNVNMLFRMGFGPKAGPEHMNNLKLMARALEINEAAPKTSPMTALAEDSLKGKTGTSFLQVMSALRAVGRRPGSGDWFAMVFGGQYIKAKIDAQKTEILREQLFDPKLLQATLLEAKSVGGSGAATLADVGGQASSRARQIRSKMWDLTKAAVGEGAPAAAAARLPSSASATADDNQ